MLEEALRITSGPVALRWPKTAARHVRPTRSAPGRSARRVRDGRRRRASSPSARWSRRPRRRPSCSPSTPSRPTVWDVRTIPLDPTMLDGGGPRHPLVVTVEDGIAEGGVGALLAARSARRRDDRAPVSSCSARPSRTFPTARPRTCSPTSASTAPGIAATAVKALRDLERTGDASRRDQP